MTAATRGVNKMASLLTVLLLSPFLIILIIFLIIVLLSSIKVVNEYERGVRFTFGKFTGIMEPGLRLVIPVIQAWRRIDIRTLVIDVPKQDTMTADNVSVQINAVIYFKVDDAPKAVLEIQDYFYAVSQLAQTTMRDVVGEVSLDQLLSQRESIAKRIRDLVDKATESWGINVAVVEIKDIELPDILIRIIAKQAEAEREKRAVIIKAEGEFEAAKNLVKAAATLTKTTGGLHIRTLQTINQLGEEKSNTTVWAIPSELLKKFVTGKG
jgi:regulator of protease activity HflC (stomatin/prohibitin superfamily)